MSRKTSPTAGRGEMLSDIQPMYWNEVFQSGQLVRLNLAGFQAEGVMFQALVTDAIGHIVKQTRSPGYEERLRSGAPESNWRTKRGGASAGRKLTLLMEPEFSVP